MIMSRGHVVELECLGFRAKVLVADDPATWHVYRSVSWHRLLPCSRQSSAPSLELAAHPSPSDLGSLVCTFPGFHLESLELTPSSLASGGWQTEQFKPRSSGINSLLPSLICSPASPSPQQLLLRSWVSFTWTWPFEQGEGAACPLPRRSSSGCPPRCTPDIPSKGQSHSPAPCTSDPSLLLEGRRTPVPRPREQPIPSQPARGLSHPSQPLPF